tara:strand:- start:1218 stop:1856 length:639 start_codon:yes stop_codon:yes gene_type:complete
MSAVISMISSSRITLFAGILVLGLSIINAFSASSITPELQRSEILSGLSGVGFMLISLLLTEIKPVKAKKVDLKGSQGLEINNTVNEVVKNELAWGSFQILKSTSASTILVWYEGEVILRRGILSSGKFVPGEICNRAKTSGKLISLVKTKLYPGRFEFNTICEELPSIMIYPLKKKGFVIVGGWSERCFTKSDESWIIGWSERLQETLINK